jgi:hypothetical protein
MYADLFPHVDSDKLFVSSSWKLSYHCYCRVGQPVAKYDLSFGRDGADNDNHGDLTGATPGVCRYHYAHNSSHRNGVRQWLHL